MKTNRRTMSAVLCILLIFALLPLNATAATVSTTITKNTMVDEVAEVTISVSGVTVSGIAKVAPGTNEVRIALSPHNSGTTALVTITPDAGIVGTANIPVGTSGGSGTITAGGEIYPVVITRESPYSPIISTTNAYIGTVPGEGATLTSTGNIWESGKLIHTFTLSAPAAGYPYPVSLRIIPNGLNADNISNFTYIYDDAGTASLEYYLGTYFLASFDNSNAVLEFSLYFSGLKTRHYRINFQSTSSGSSGKGVYAYLPAPGQFTNEGIDTGGWGDIFVSGSTGLKALVQNNQSAGVSLGFFGGYVVADVGTVETITPSGTVYSAQPITNDPNNRFGVDFIVYGNAFQNNSEPGCIQVAEGIEVKDQEENVMGYAPGDKNGDGVTWYDIAGSLHYNSSTIWDAEYNYTNPVLNDDLPVAYPQSGTTYPDGVNYTYTHNGTSGSGTIDYNSWHNHSWFPLWANYSVGRNGASAMDKAGSLSFVTRTRTLAPLGSSVTDSKAIFSGVMLGSATNTQTANYTFGYCDVHPNGNSYGTASNPYAATASTTGGDGIDISWAVYPAGTIINGADVSGHPVNLTNGVHFIRIYTGAAAMNGPFGEISTEVCGIYKAQGTGSGAAVKDLTVKRGTSTIYGINHMGTKPVYVMANTAHTFNITSGADYVYVNGELVSCTSSTPYSFNVNLAVGETEYVQIITQTGTASPFVTLLKLTGTAKKVS